MNIMFDNEINSVTSMTNDTNSEKDNLLTIYPKQTAQATENTTTIVLDVFRLTDLYIGNTNATTGHIAIVVDAVTVMDKDLEFYIVDTYDRYYTSDLLYMNQYVVSLGALYYDATITITLDLDHPTDDVYCGLLMAGYAKPYGEAQWGLTDKPKDFAFTKETINGSIVYLKNEVIRNKDIPIICYKDEWEYLYHDLIFNRGKYSVIVGAKNMEYPESYLRYGLINALPQGKETYNDVVTATLNVREIL